MTFNELVTAYTRYKSKRKELRENLRQVLESNLHSYRVDFGEQLVNLRAKGVPMDTLLAHTVMNRNFAYQCIQEYRDTLQPKIKQVTPEIPPAVLDTEIIFDDEKLEATFENTTIKIVNGAPEIPSEWFDNPKRFKPVLERIREHFDL